MTPVRTSPFGLTPLPPGVLMVAIGGYGSYYLEKVLELEAAGRARLVGVVDPQARQSRVWSTIASRTIPVVDTVEQFYDTGHLADLAVIVSPIQFHVPQSVAALKHGSNVLCDKPLGATIQEARELIDARDASGRWVMIGYQWSYSIAIQTLKRDLLAGRYGRVRRMVTLCCWPRDHAYYQRNYWAGHLRDPRNGRWVLDSPSNNGMAHFLHNLLYLAGSTLETSATIRSVTGECYRAYDIESADTTCLRAVLDAGAEVVQLASHATEETIQPRFRIEFDSGAVITAGERFPNIVAVDRLGERMGYGIPDESPQFQKLFDAVDAVTNPTLPVCGPEAASAQTLAIDGLHESCPRAVPFGASLVREDGRTRARTVPGLGEVLLHCYERAFLPSELGASWARAGQRIDLENYRYFPINEPRP